MEHPETHQCTTENGPRPAGPPDECFYCKVKVGQEHKEDCGLRSRSVVVRFIFHCVVMVPEDWDQDMIDFHYNESTWCAHNALDFLDTRKEECCWCSDASAEYLGEATEDDESKYDWEKAEK